MSIHLCEGKSLQMQKKGVFPASKKNGTVYYRSSFTYRKKHISLGSYSTAEEANLAYQEATSLISRISTGISDYSVSSHLAFCKWVSIINYRDNGIYFSTPIYLRPNFFYYYLEPHLDLKFDRDDLFYYSTRTIMKRNGHLFVSDYGMQFNIVNRYGIRNYSVAGRDFRFVNGDSTDFRYSNIEIINRYFGVCKVLKKGLTLYKATIHVKSNYIIGYYNTEAEAAIAYNKAIDCLFKAGITKKYTPNFVEGISPSQYADIYSGLSIANKISTLTHNQ